MKRLCISLLLMVLSLSIIQAQSLKQEGFTRHHISLSFFDMLMARYGLDYEYVVDSAGYFSIHVPASYVLRDYSNIFNVRNEEIKFWVGIGMNIYPTGQGKWRYFLGPELRYKFLDCSCYIDENQEIKEQTDIEPPNPNSIYQVFYNQVKLAFYINNGLVYTPTKHFALTLYLGLGMQSYVTKPKVKGYREISSTATFGLRIGYKF